MLVYCVVSSCLGIGEERFAVERSSSGHTVAIGIRSYVWQRIAVTWSRDGGPAVTGKRTSQMEHLAKRRRIRVDGRQQQLTVEQF